MRESDFNFLSEANIDDLTYYNPSVDKKELKKVGISAPKTQTVKTVTREPQTVRQGILKRLAKKLTAASLLGVLGSAAGTGVGLLASPAIGPAAGAIGLLAGVIYGAKKYGKKYITKHKKIVNTQTIRIGGKSEQEFLEETGLGSRLDNLYNKYLSVDALKQTGINFAEVKYGVNAIVDATIDDPTQSPTQIDAIKSAASDDIKILRQHLHQAAVALETMSKANNLSTSTINALYERRFGSYPLQKCLDLINSA